MSFSFKDREDALGSLKGNPPELLIIGGGVVGSSLAAHAARFDLNVLLIEKDDIASGASGNSTGLAHAGLRYLAQGRLGYVFHESRERDRLQEIAPHWVHPFNFILPVYKTDPFPLWMVQLGTFIYDLLGWIDALLTKRPLARRHQTLSAEEIKKKVPGIRAENLAGGIEYYVDARLQDSRFTLGYAQQAAQHGARVVTHFELLTASGSGPINVSCRDQLTREIYDFHVPLVINTTGAWIDEVRKTSGMEGEVVQKSKGIHLVVDHIADSPLILSSAVKGKVFFVIPIDAKRTLVGTTDTAVSAPINSIGPDERDITELLQHLFHFFPSEKQGANLKEAVALYKQKHVRDIYWGVRPLLAQAGGTLDASREHKLVKDLPGFWSFPGVKLTAGRAAGLEAAVEAWKFLKPGVPEPAVTWDSLPGGELYDYTQFVADAERRFKLGENSEALMRYLVSMYGTRYMEILQWMHREDHFADRVLPEEPWVFAQVPFAVHEEMVLSLNDFLWRRTKWAHWCDLPETAIRKIAEIMGHYLFWSPEETTRQIADYNQELKKHRPHEDQ